IRFVVPKPRSVTVPVQVEVALLDASSPPLRMIGFELVTAENVESCPAALTMIERLLSPRLPLDRTPKVPASTNISPIVAPGFGAHQVSPVPRLVREKRFPFTVTPVPSTVPP